MKKVAQKFGEYLSENICGYFGGNFWKIWATFYADIWSLWTPTSPTPMHSFTDKFFILHRLYLFHPLVSFELLSLETFLFIFLSHHLNFRFCVFFDNLKFILRLMIPLYPAVQDQQEREEKTFSTFDDFYSGKRHHSILTRLRSAIRLKCSDDGAGSKLQSHFKFSLAWKILCTWVLSFLTDFIFRNASLNAAS